MKLSPRLAAIAKHIQPGARVADIGTDHGLLPVYLALDGAAGAIFASDISAGPLCAARRSAAKHDLEGRIAFVNAPGLTGLIDADIDTAVIAGMGGETMIDILAESPWANARRVRLILQPQTKVYELSRWLAANGYAIEGAELVRDRGKDYTIIVALGEPQHANNE